jgi:hypothetical protein
MNMTFTPIVCKNEINFIPRMSRHDKARRYSTFASVLASRMVARSGFPIAQQGTRVRLLTDGLNLNRNLSN